MADIFIRVNDKKLSFARRFELAKHFAWLTWKQLIGRNAELRIWDCADGTPLINYKDLQNEDKADRCHV